MDWIYIILLTNAITGFVLIEWILWQTKIFRTLDEKRDAMFPAWRKNGPKNLTRWNFYLGVFNIMPLRVILVVSTVVFVYSREL